MLTFISKQARLRCICPMPLALLAIACMPGMALAESEAQELEPIEVVASPIIEETALDLFSDISSVVSEDQLRDQNAVDLASALRRTPGVQVSRFNPVGSFGGEQDGLVLIRGMGASRPGSEIKTYIDGVPFYMGVWNHPLLDLLPINGMQSITVHKSPQPQLNGNNFASIDLATKRATQDGLHGSGRISGGIFGTFAEQAEITGKHGDIDYSLAQGYARSDGHRDNANGELVNVMGRVGWQINEHWSAALNFLYTDNESNDPGDNRLPKPAVAPKYTTQADLVALNLAHKHGNWQGDLKLYTSQGSGNWLDQNGPGINTLSDFDMYGIRWKEQYEPWTGGQLVVGLDQDWTSGKVLFQPGNSSIDAPTFSLTSPYIAFSQRIELNKDWDIVPSAGVRVYDHSHFDAEPAPHAGLSLVSDRFTLFGNYARGINYPGLEAPTLSALIPPLGKSWKQLSAEEMEHFEVGFKATPFDTTQIDVSWFNDNVSNRFIFGFPPAVPPPPQFINLGSYHINGAEIAVQQEIMENWRIFGGLTLLYPSIDNLPYTPKRAVTAGITGEIAKFRIAVDAQYQSEVYALNRARFGGTLNTGTVSAFTVVNARVSYPLPMLGEKGEAFIAVENLLDRDYAYRPGYPMPGIWGQIGLAASF